VNANPIDVGILTVIPVELNAALEALGIEADKKDKDREGNYNWYGSLRSRLTNRDYHIALRIIGTAGNYDSTAAAMSLIKDFSPKILLLAGIAAGVRGKIKIGEVVLSERVVAYESAVLDTVDGEPVIVPRPNMARIPYPVEQDVATYGPKESDLLALFASTGGRFPTARPGEEEVYKKEVASTISSRPATIASGEKLLRNPDQLKTLRRDMHGRIEAGEMEASGIMTACHRTGVPWLVIRGISDFGDEFKSDEFHIFAARTAAVVLSDFIQNGLHLDYSHGTSGLVPVQADADYPHLDDLLVQLPKLIHPASIARKFNVRLSLASSFEDILIGRFTKADQTPSQIQKLTNERRLLIHAPGGSGKTAVMCEIAREAILEDQVVFFLDLKTGSSAENLGENFTVDNLFELFSVAGNAHDFRTAIDKNDTVLLMIDGLNEVYGPLSNTILKRFERLLLDHPKLKVIIADRMNAHADFRFLRATVTPLSESEVKTLLPTGANLPRQPAEIQLLSTPFFLDLQLSLWENMASGSITSQSILARKDMFVLYFTHSAKVTENSLPQLAEAAYLAYKQYQGRTFDPSWWSSKTSVDVTNQLDNAGLIVDTVTASGERKKMFRHQLIHDFLTGYHVARIGATEWTSEVFDAATFKSNAAEPLSFAAEILGKEADEFLIRVYDWSYRIVDRCIADLKKALVHYPVSKDLELGLLVKNAEKKFDVFDHTAQASERSLLDAVLPEAKLLIQAQSMDDVLAVVRNFQPSTSMFKEWKDLFLLDRKTRIGEKELLLLDSNPIIGWTAANTFRRVYLSKERIAQVRMMYQFALRNGNGTLRWRIVHLLGRYPSSQNISLLQTAIVADPYEWARYGAIRSLMEIAYLAGGETRAEIIDGLLSNLQEIKSSLIVREIRRTCLVREAGPEWYSAIGTLAEKAATLPEAEVEREEWNDLLDEIHKRMK
jgi:nucleoside phosphorylase